MCLSRVARRVSEVGSQFIQLVFVALTRLAYIGLKTNTVFLNSVRRLASVSRLHSSQRGLGLPSALFLIVVMVLIIAAINQLNEMNALAYGREWLSMRAFYAAESGAQTAAIYVLNPAQALPTCDANFISSLNLPASGLSGCSVSVVCDLQVVATQNYYTLTSTGSCGGGMDQATRVIQVRLQL